MLAQAFAGSSTTNSARAFTVMQRQLPAGVSGWPLAAGDGGLSGFACARLNSDLGLAYWNIGARACGSGGNKGVYSMD